MDEYFMGIDVSKGYADFIVIDRRKTIIENVFQLDDTFEGHNQLFNILQDFFIKHPDSIIYAAVESTGGLENNWLRMLVQLNGLLNIKAARINPVGPNALHKASLERNGSDAISARKIADYLIAYPEKVIYNVEDPYVALRKQYHLIEMLKKQKTQLLNQLGILLYTSMPFLVSYCQNGVPRWLLELITKYPSASKLARAQETTLVRIHYVTNSRARQLIKLAKQNVGSATDQTMAFVIKSATEQILHLKKSIDRLKENLEKSCDLPEVALLETMPGMGRYSAIGLLMNIVSIERFPTAKHLASYFGLHPVYKQSGDGFGEYKMSKKGRAVPRQILFMVARAAITYNPLIKEIYIDQLKAGKTKMSAIGVCMHKILRIVFGMLKHNQPFDPAIDQRNKNKTRWPSNEAKLYTDKKRRYQSLSIQAPISRRQVKKRKEKQSQAAQSDIYGIDVSPS